MSAIIGYCSPESPLDVHRLDQMRDSLTHRGPDAATSLLWNTAGQRLDNGEPGTLALAHRQLSLPSIPASVPQPTPNPMCTAWIALDGGIHNASDLRATPQEAESEILLRLIERDGLPNALHAINGAIALAYIEPTKKRCLIARDRMGEKPLYYIHRPDGTLLFASEIKALVAGGFVDRTRIDPIALDQFWTLGYPCGERTIFQDVRQLLPGCYAEWDNGRLTIHRYWEIRIHPVAEDQPFDPLLQEFTALLEDAIRIRIVPEAPTGIFLSGGIDSTLIAGMARRLHPEITAYTIAFQDNAVDESGHAARIAEYLGLRHSILRPDCADPRCFAAIAQQYDSPLGDVSSVPTWHLCQQVRTHAKVVLTGDAGDELFGGYTDYSAGLSYWGNPAQRAMFRSPETFRAVLSGLRNRMRGPARGFVMWARQLNQRHKRLFYTPELLKACPLSETLAERLYWGKTNSSEDALAIMQDIDVHTYLVDDALPKADRMCMAASIDGRAPLLDYRIVEFAARLPFHAKFDEKGRGKYLLRRALARLIPEKLWERPKQGFVPPWARWMNDETRRELSARWERVMPQHGFLPEGGKALLSRTDGNFPILSWNILSALEFFDPTPPTS